MRKMYIDLLRQIALFHMMFQHAFLAVLKTRDKTGFTDFLDEIIPLCPALFLFIAGYSATLKDNDPPATSLKHMKRGIILIALGMLLFFIENGIQLPDMLFSPGILHSIGIFSLLLALLFLFPKPGPVLIALIGAATAFFIFSDIAEIPLYPLTDGYEPWLPTILFGLIGTGFGLFFKKLKPEQSRKALFVLFTLGAVITAVYTVKYGFLRILFDDVGRRTIGRIFNTATMLPDLFTQSPNISFIQSYVWNFTTHSFIAVFGLILILFSFFKYIDKPVLQKIPSAVFLPGRCAFVNYFYHLSVLAVIVVVFGYNTLGKAWFYLLLFTFYAVSYLLSYGTVKIRKKKKQAPGTATFK